MGEKTYVKLTKEQEASLQDITPGELNQPIDIHQLRARRCPECGQTLPPSYEPPADEDWSTGICGCADDPESCMTGLFCPCVLFGRNVEHLNDEITSNSACWCHVICVEGGMTLAAITAFLNGVMDPGTSCLITEGLFFAWWMCGIYTGMARQSIQRKYHLKDSPCDPCIVHCCLHWCALCQEHREMKCRLAESVVAERVVVNPPPVQEMKAAIEKSQKVGTGSSSSSSSSSPTRDDGGENKNLQLQVV